MLPLVLFWVSQLSDNSVKSKNQKDNGKRRCFDPVHDLPGYNPKDAKKFRARHWGYDYDNGPPTWPIAYEDCGGCHQSPIHIRKEESIEKKGKNLLFANYNQVPDKMFLENSKASIHLTCVWQNSNSTPYVTGGVLDQRYYFSQLHFHWGKTSDSGSEHKINGKSYPAEMHVVHELALANPASAPKDLNRFVVVSYMLEINSKNNEVFAPILEASKRVEGKEVKKTELHPFSMETIVQSFHCDYFIYEGSLTTPPCTEGVIWIINPQPLTISDDQLKVLRNSVKNEKGVIFSNARNLQPLNEREIYYMKC